MTSSSGKNNDFQILSQESSNYEAINIGNNQNVLPSPAYSIATPYQQNAFQDQNLIDLKRKMKTKGKCYFYLISLLALYMIVQVIRMIVLKFTIGYIDYQGVSVSHINFVFALLLIEAFLFVLNAYLARKAVFHFNYKCMIWSFRLILAKIFVTIWADVEFLLNKFYGSHFSQNSQEYKIEKWVSLVFVLIIDVSIYGFLFYRARELRQTLKQIYEYGSQNPY